MMKRRDLIKFAAAGALLLSTGGLASAADTIDYKPGLVKQALASGKTVFVDYAADWCTTCKSQERTV